MTLLTVNNLKTHYRDSEARNQEVKAVDDVSFEIEQGTTLGIVGENKCGKSTLSRTLVRLQPATAGDVYFDGTDILALSAREFLPYRQRMQLIFPDSANALNPRISVGKSVAEGVDLLSPKKPKLERREEVEHLFEKVKLSKDLIKKFPHELNNGQRQRVGIARALSVNPKLIICDELIAGLDVSVQAEIVNLLQDLQRESGLTYLFTSSNIALTQHISTQIVVMYRGKIVESANASEIHLEAKHEYTRKLLAASPKWA